MLTLYNTLSRDKETFKPIADNLVCVYACGVTVYDYCHIGHARTYVSVDVLVRYLKWKGYEVKYVRNITDIDDKIIKRAQENNEDTTALTSRFIKAMYEDFANLNLINPNFEPRATLYIEQMISLIQDILKNNHAYIAANGDVYFDVRSSKKYGCLSHHDIEELESGARVEVSDAKRDPLDFVLWKIAKPNEPSWDSPWGKGRPGWHIECSAMSIQLLGESFDIHAGGRDLIFPHHENEIAQAHAAGASFAKHWFHGGFLQIEKEKMSKSLGNFVTIRDVLQNHDPEVLRYLLLASHYRSPLSYSEDSLLQAKQALSRLYTALRGLPITEQKSQSTEFEQKFTAAMDDDLNTPIALSALFELAHEIQRLRGEGEVERANQSAALLRYLGGGLGLLQNDPEAFFKARTDVDSEQISTLIAARDAARKEKNWGEADRIRKTLLTMSIMIEDTPQGTIWKSLK